MPNCTECISKPEPGTNVCGRGIKVTLPEKTLCRKYLKHTVSNFNGKETHYLTNANGKMFDITDQVVKNTKEEK